MTAEQGTQINVLQKAEIILNILNHICIGFIAIYMTYFCVNLGLNNHLSLHAWLCTIGYQVLMAEAILSMYTANSWTVAIFQTRKARTTVHWVLMILGCGLGLGGSFYFIDLAGGRFKSIHAITGLASTVIILVSLISGLAAQYSQTLRNILSPILNKTIHNFLGLSGFIIGMVSLYYGYKKRFIADPSGDRADFSLLLQGITIVTIVLSIIGAIKSFCRNVNVMIR